MSDEENFLSRWSRRKLKARAETAAPQAAELPATASAAQPATGSALPVSESPAPELPEEGGKPEYREFFDPKVDEKVRRTALKKLFSDPHFNVMDGLDTYIDDYSKPDPIPEAMLRQLNQAKNLFLFDEKKEPDAEEQAQLAQGPATSALPVTTTEPAAPPPAVPPNVKHDGDR